MIFSLIHVDGWGGWYIDRSGGIGWRVEGAPGGRGLRGRRVEGGLGVGHLHVGDDALDAALPERPVPPRRRLRLLVRFHVDVIWLPAILNW